MTRNPAPTGFPDGRSRLLRFVELFSSAWLLWLPGMLGPTASIADILFQDVAAQQGINCWGRAYGSSWGDINHDGWPDLVTGCHSGRTRFLINNGDGTFTDRLEEVWPDAVTVDAHGAGWADFDNDGDQDLFILTGAATGTASVPNLFLVNYAGTLTDEASLRGLDYPLGRGRMPLWLDWNGDGYLDAFEAAEVREGATSELFVQGHGMFADIGLSNLTKGQSNYFAQVRDLVGDGNPKLIIHRDYDYPGLILAVDADPPEDLTESLGVPHTSRVIDAVIEDLDGDLDNDIFLLRTNRSAPEAIQTEPTVVETYVRVNGNERGIAFAADSDLFIEANPSWYVSPQMIFIGASGRNPDKLAFNVSTADTGIFAHTPGVDTGIYIGFDPAAASWTILASSPSFRSIEMRASAAMPINDLHTIGFTNGGFYLPERLLIQTDSGFEDRTLDAGFGDATGCESGVAADFDNDTDLDLYLVCRSQVDNPPNLLFENLGGGSFQPVPNAGGAGGSIQGRGNNVAVADFDRDGFLDLFVTNGWGHPLLASDGRFELFRNLGNENHWIGLNLVGKVSNRDAVGAKVLLSAGGKTQVREQGGGVHNKSQNHQLIHFGLGDSNVVDEVVIHWPSGRTQVINNLLADRQYEIVETNGSGIDPDGAPVYDANIDKAIFLWRESDGNWRLRATGGGEWTRYSGRLDSSQPLPYVVPVELEPDDLFDTRDPAAIVFRLAMMNGWQDGFDFATAPNAQTCLDIDLPAGASVQIGATRTPVAPPFNLTDFGPCTEPGIDPDGAPVYDANIDKAIFLWRESDGNWRLRATGGGEWTRYSGRLDSSQPLPYVVPVELEPDDLFDTRDPAAIVFRLAMMNGWQDGFDFATAPNAQTCLNIDLPAGASVQIGATRTPVAPPFNLTDFGPCTEPGIDPDGAPVYDANIDKAIFLWRESDGNWRLRATGGGESTRYSGRLDSSQPLPYVVPVELEPDDLFDTRDPAAIVFRLAMMNGWQDGFDFATAPNAQTCLNIDLPAGASVQIGATRTPVAPPFNLTDFGPCP